MDRSCIYITVVFVFVLHVQVQGGVPDPCDITPLNGITQDIIDAMVSAGLATENPDSRIVTVVDGKLTQMLTDLCTPSIRAKLLEIQNLISGCQQLLGRGDSKLNLIQIKGVALAQLFVAFSGVDNFCNCQTHLPMAWGLKEAVLTHTDNSAIFQTIADVGEICSDVTKAAITTIANFETTDECANPITNQAGFDTTEKKARLASLKEFVDNNCANFAADKWSCVTEKDSMGDVGNCMTSWASQQPQTKVDCAKRICVTTFIGGPCDTAADLYIAAVKFENSSALLDMGAPCSGLDISCVTYAGVMSINQAVQAIFGGIAQYVDMTSGTPVIADADIPAIFSKLCTDAGFYTLRGQENIIKNAQGMTSTNNGHIRGQIRSIRGSDSHQTHNRNSIDCHGGLKAAMTTIQTAATNCVYTTLLATQLGSLTIKGVAFAQFFVMFPNVDTFCQCSSALPPAWAIRVDTTDRTFTDNDAAFRIIADVSKVCSFPWKDVVVADVCKTAMRDQAGYTDDRAGDFDNLYAIAEQCGTNTNTDWTCMKGVAKNNAFGTCISTEGSKVGDKARCGRYDCVEEHMKTCTADARRLYIKAVNAENTDAIKMDRTGCDDAAVFDMSVLVLVACFILNRL